MYRIAKQFHFSASHQLRHLPPDHQCARLHGHNYVVELILEGDQLDASGFIVDYGNLKGFQQIIDRRLDHRHLNDVLDDPTGRATTAENLSRWLFSEARSLYGSIVKAVRVSETPKTWAEYSE